MKCVRNPLPCFSLVRSLSEFVGDLPEEHLLCPVYAVRIYLDTTTSLTLRPRSLFVSLRCLLCALSKNVLLLFLRQVISDAGAIWDISAGLPRAHSVRGVATSAVDLCNWLVVEAATWRSNPVFAAFYFNDLSSTLGNCGSLGPFCSCELSYLLIVFVCIRFASSPFRVRVLLPIRRYLPFLTFMSSIHFSLGWHGRGFGLTRPWTGSLPPLTVHHLIRTTVPISGLWNLCMPSLFNCHDKDICRQPEVSWPICLRLLTEYWWLLVLSAFTPVRTWYSNF